MLSMFLRTKLQQSFYKSRLSNFSFMLSLSDDSQLGKKISTGTYTAKLASKLHQSAEDLANYTSNSKDTTLLSAYAGNFLFYSFEAAVSGVSYSEQELSTLCRMSSKLLPGLAERVDDNVLNFPLSTIENSKMERSGLEFLFEWLRKSGSETLKAELKKFEEEQEVWEWNNILKTAYFDPLYDGGESLVDLTKIPSSHDWWF